MGSGSRARAGEFSVLWLIVTLVGIVMALVIMYLVYGGVNRSLNTANAPMITATTLSGNLFVNIKDAGVGSLSIENVILYAGTSQASCTSATYYLDGEQLGGGLPITLKPGQTLTIVYSSCSPGVDEVTGVAVITSSGTYTATVS
ncbi:hypothetical protein VMUT_1008 [Vulcanisaeta moutnovskia 768-28]|uniref:Uncharacterized protein n=1 Tax=Vulcanisaeta moutnovskia (strain 768-28) TaxID=985053 RepID=F0QXQ2_VULM7|nr:hypothetical protein [Vulcanisaeta moutnovskia]ADY01215.1 hypothetical protein VMUT_1008 [Vulcanisaeta moutnovskia 768-28]